MSSLNFLDAFGYHPNFEKYAEIRNVGYTSLTYRILDGSNVTIMGIVQRHLPFLSNYNGIMRLKTVIGNIGDEGISTSFKVGHIVRGIGEVLFLGTVLFWLIDLIVTLGRMLQVKCADRSESSLA